MPISSGAGGKPNSYFNSANALSRRPSASSIPYNGGGGGYGGGGGSPGYYYGSYGGGEPVAMATGGAAAYGAATPRGVQVLDVSSGRVAQNGQPGMQVTRDNAGRSCCPCPSRNRPEMRMPTMPKSKMATAGGSVTRHGCCIFLLGLLALATVAGLIAGLYFLGVELTGIRLARQAFYLLPGRRTGDLMWVIYGTTQECEPVTTSTASTTTTTAATTTDISDATTVSSTSTTSSSTTTATTLISCASTTFRYEQVTLAGGGPAKPSWPLLSGVAAAAFLYLPLRSLAIG